MDDVDKLLWMFKEVHGDIDEDKGQCYTEVVIDDEASPIAVDVMKGGNLCWRKTKLDIVFDYLTKNLE